MYFLDQTQFINTLEEDWSNILKLIKKRQELYYELLSQNQQIVKKDRKCDDQSQLDHQIVNVKAILTKVSHQNKSLEAQLKQINEKYQNSSTSGQDVHKIMTRVASKVIEITQSALQKSKIIDASLQDKHNRMKRNVINMLSQRQKLNLQHLHNVIFDYGQNKLQNQLFKMQKIIMALQNKEYHKLIDIQRPKEKIRTGSVERIREVIIQRRRDYSQTKEESNFPKRSEKGKKEKNKVLCQLYGIMLLSKHQFTQDYSTFTSQKKQRLFNDLVFKNRKNSNHILTFRECEQSYLDKISKFQQNLISPKQTEQSQQKQKINQDPSKQKVKMQNYSYSDSLNNKHKNKMKNINESISFRQFLATQADTYRKQQEEQTEGEKSKNRLFGTRGKTSTKDSDDFPNIFNKTLATQQNQYNGKYEHIVKKQIRFEMNKSKLPDIYRKSSLDGKGTGKLAKLASSRANFKDDINNIQEQIVKNNKRVEKWFKDDKISSQRTKMILKNVEVGIPPMNPKKQEWLVRQQKVIVKERKKTDNMIGQTAYCKRTLTKFFDNKFNGLA